jgi:hypothetical protein
VFQVSSRVLSVRVSSSSICGLAGRVHPPPSRLLASTGCASPSGKPMQNRGQPRTPTPV